MTSHRSRGSALGRGHQRGLLCEQVRGEDVPQQRRVDSELDHSLSARPVGERTLREYDRRLGIG